MKVTFNGPNRLIIVNQDETNLNVKTDIYSAWKEWLTQGNNTCYLPALSAIGGDPISEALALGTTFFLENGWKVRPFEGDHTLNLVGNIYTRDGTSPTVKTIGDYNVTVVMNRSNIIDTVATSGGGSVDMDQLATAVWQKLINGKTAASLVQNISDNVEDNQALILAGL